MGNILGVPVGHAVKTVLWNENGYLAGCREVRAYFYLEQKYKNNRRTDVYDMEKFDINDLESINFVIPRQENALEYPRKLSTEDDVDSIFFCGFNSKKEKLVAKISCNKKGLATACVIFQLANEKIYSLSEQKLYRVPSRTGPETFSAGGLRLRCLQAMRKWRISFSGLLNDLQSESSNEEALTYVKFSFIWTTSSAPYDVTYDIPTKLFARFLSREPVITLEGLTCKMDHIIQSGSFCGTYMVDKEKEQEMYLWGARKRSLEQIPRGETYAQKEYFAYLEEGEMIYLSTLGSSDSNSKFLHGFIVQQNSQSGPIVDCNKSINNEEEKITFQRNGFSWTATFTVPDKDILSYNADGSSSRIRMAHVMLDYQKGNSVIIDSNWLPVNATLNSPKYYLKNIEKQELVDIYVLQHVLKLKDPICRDTTLTGGKGSSLADLHVISSLNGTFYVPRGLVVTTVSYEEFLKYSDLQKDIRALETVAWKNLAVGLKKECERVSAKVSEAILPDSVKGAIRNALIEEFGNNLKSIRFAVRSSASGEDSEEMSAAGQMKTFLGIEGLEMVYDAVVKCWASQFGFIPIQYKRQNGQILNSPMAVVIQEMVAADVAGVMFTCDPVTGNPTIITITSNYGIGESVVSASAEPDTIAVVRGRNGEYQVDSIHLGAKKSKTVMTSTGVVDQELPEDFSSQCSLSPVLAKQLADLGVQVKESYGCLVDVEWAVKDNLIYLLQARPVMTFDKETDFEIVHENDTALRCEDEWISTANTGEVFPGAMSHLGGSAVLKAFQAATRKLKYKRVMVDFDNPYFTSGSYICANHAMGSVLDGLLRNFHEKHTLASKSFNLLICGRILDDPEMLERATKRNKYYKSLFAPTMLYYLAKDLLTAASCLKKRRKEFPVGSRLEIPLSHTADKIFTTICRQWFSLGEKMMSHIHCSMISSISNLGLVLALSNETGDMSTAMSDLGYVLSNCSEVESAEVPNAIEKVAKAIIETKDATVFHKMELQEALLWLERTDSLPGKEFRMLLKNHSHRGIQEFDVFSKPWGSDPIPLVKTIQGLVAQGNIQERPKAPDSVSKTIQNIKVPLTWKKRMILRLLVPICRKSVGLREGGKSMLISVFDCMRHSYRRFAEQMVAEGRLPDTELTYFLTHMEHYELMQTRSPKLVQKAIRRRSLYPYMNEMVFPEISRGIPKPVS